MKIQNKLILFITSIVIAVVIITSYLSLNLFKKMVIDIEKENFSTLLKVFAYSCKLDIDRFVEALAKDDTVLYAMVLSTDGEVIVHSDKSFEGRKLDDAVTLSAISAKAPRFHDIVYKNKKGIDAAMPITSEKIKWSIVRIGFSTQNIEEGVIKARNFILLLGGFSVLFGIAIAYLFSRRIVSPIVKLTRKAEKIAMGERDVSFDFPIISYPDCKKILKCDNKSCPLYDNRDVEEACWERVGKFSADSARTFEERSRRCENCPVFKKFMGNEINRLVETFKAMYESIRFKENALKEDEIKLTRVNVQLQNTLNKLMDSRAKYKTLSESARDIIFTLDLKGKITFVNNMAMEILRVESASELIGKSFTALLTAESRHVAFERFKDTRAGKETQAFEVQAHKGGGTETIPLELIISPIIEGGELAGIHGIARDISDRKSLEAQLIQTSKLSSIGELATGIAHELNQPLMIIRGYSQLINSDINEGDKHYDELSLIEKHTDRMSKIISHLQAFSRQAAPYFSAVDLSEVIDNSMIMVSEHLKLNNIEVTKNVKDDLPNIHGDSSRLEQVFLNMITNARDAMAEKGSGVLEFTIDLSDDSKFVVVKISDTGRGIKSTDIDNIFNPFFTTKEVGKGTGLGLSISYGIIKSHRGTITVNSKEGEGTVFTISFPACEDEECTL